MNGGINKNMNGKVLIFNRYPLKESFHLKTKFDGQINGFKDLGFDTGILCYDEKYFYIDTGDEKQKIGSAHTWLPYYYHLFYYINAGVCMRRYLKSCSGVKVLYYRSGPCFRVLYKMAQTAFQKGINVVCELPSYYGDGKGEKHLSIFRTMYTVIWEFWQRRMDKYITLYALIGDKNESGIYRGRPSVDISNAINIDSIALRNPIIDKKVHILALGTMGEYHGFDRLIRASARYNGNIDYIIHFVGNNAGGCLEDWKRLAQDLHTGNRIVFHGPLYGEDLDKMFDICDVGISSLGAYRIGVKSLASLKLREYAARGLAFVYSADDNAIDNETECQRFALKISNDDSIPNMEEILNFAMRVKSDINLPVYEREYARKNMQWQEQFKRIIDKLSEIEERD